MTVEPFTVTLLPVTFGAFPSTISAVYSFTSPVAPVLLPPDELPPELFPLLLPEELPPDELLPPEVLLLPEELLPPEDELSPPLLLPDEPLLAVVVVPSDFFSTAFVVVVPLLLDFSSLSFAVVIVFFPSESVVSSSSADEVSLLPVSVSDTALLLAVEEELFCLSFPQETIDAITVIAATAAINLLYFIINAPFFLHIQNLPDSKDIKSDKFLSKRVVFLLYFYLVFVDLIIVLEEYEIDGHIAVECTKLINELLLVHIIKNINTVYELEQCTEVCGLDSSELVECCVS